MNIYLWLLTFKILIIFYNIPISLSLASEIIPIYKIILSPNLNKLDGSSSYQLILNNIKGIGLIFDTNSENNIMPMHLIKYIQSFYEHFEETITDFLPNEKENEYFELILNYYYGGSESLHLIFEKFGISIPIADLLKYDEEELIHRFKFLTKENQENIIIGKDLIEFMNIDFKDINNIIINKKYISKLENKE